MGNTYHVAAERLVQAVRPSVTIARQKIRDAPNQTRGALGPITPRLLTPLGHGYCSGHELRDWLCCGWSPASAWSRHTRADSDGGWARVWLRSWVSALSWVGIGLSTITLLAMPPLAQAKRRVGSALGSPATISESRQTMLCAYLSAALLIGLLANAIAGWWWADPLVALMIGAVAAREGREAWKGESCGCC